MSIILEVIAWGWFAFGFLVLVAAPPQYKGIEVHSGIQTTTLTAILFLLAARL